jgi:hypothetical protein
MFQHLKRIAFVANLLFLSVVSSSTSISASGISAINKLTTSSNVALGKPVTITTNGANDSSQGSGLSASDITDGSLDYEPASSMLEDGVVGYVNLDYSQVMEVTINIDLGAEYNITGIRYNMGDVQFADTWNADTMISPFGSTTTNPGDTYSGVWTEQTGNITTSDITVILQKTRQTFYQDWLFIGEIEVLGTPTSITPYEYTTFEGDTISLYPYEGVDTALLVDSPNLNPLTISKIVNTLDGTYAYYKQSTGREPTLHFNYNGLSTVAQVPSTCGAGCGFLGATGIELLDSTFIRLYDGVINNNEFDQTVFYEFGRNFWFYRNEIEYKGSDDTGTITTGYAVFMRFMAMNATSVDGGPFNGSEFSEFEDEVRELYYSYLADTSLTWDNTLKIGQAPSNALGLGGTDLFASFLFNLRDMFGEHFVQQIWKEVENRPDAQTTQDAVDNFVLAASATANRNLTAMFESWRWPISASALTEASNRFGIPSANMSINYSSGSQGSYFTVVGTGFPANETATISVNGRIVSSSIPVNSAGYFAFVLDTTLASEGNYYVTASVNPSATTTFSIDSSQPLRSQMGNAETIGIPSSIALDNSVFLPFVQR